MSDDRVNENADRVEEALQRHLTDEDRAAAADAAKAKVEGAADAASGAAAGAADTATGAVSGAADAAKGMAGRIGGAAAAGAAGLAAGAKGMMSGSKDAAASATDAAASATDAATDAAASAKEAAAGAMSSDERRAAVGSTGEASVTTTTTTSGSTATTTTSGTAGRGAVAGSAGDGGGVAGAEKLIPEWGWSADNQIIAVGLVVLASIAGVAGWNTWRNGGDGEDVVAAVTEVDGTTATTILDEDGNVVTTVADSEIDDTDDEAAATTTTVQVTTTQLDLAPDVDAAVGAFGIAAATAGSETVLSGFVGTDAESERAEARAAAVDGITSVDNQLVVLEPQAQAAIDANSVRNGLASASGTVITATGIVDDETDRAATISALEAIEGVTGVDDQLTVIQDRAAAAVATQADGLDVTVADGVVTVTGTVVSEALEANALRAPMALPGVVEVIDQVEVDSPTANALNEIVDLAPVQFATNSAEILPASAATLDAAAEVILAAPEGTKVAVRGYTDVRGDDEANLALSQARTESVVAALVERGVDAAALSPVGLGETEQFGEGDDPEALAANRRVVFAQL